MTMEFKDYYATLGLAKDATDADIKKAYRKLARQYHPDLHPGDKSAEAKFKDVNEANEVLGDPEKRRKYDELGANWRAYEQGPPPGSGRSPFSGGPSGAGGSYRTVTPDEMREMFGEQDPFSSFFHTFFGGQQSFGDESDGRRGGRSARQGRARDVEQTIDLTLEEAFAGTTRKLISQRDGKERSVEVRIPAGVREGARIRATGEGAAASRGGKAGDLYLTVHILPHARFQVNGGDLTTTLEVPVATAVLGGEVSVPTLTGASLRLKVPELTTEGRVFRLRGHGLPAVGKPDERGDLYATVRVQLPTRLSDDERAHYEALKALQTRRG